jgi:hypothetical protein
MPEKRTLKRARRDLRQGKSPSTAAGEFVKEEMEHIRKRKHGAKSTRQAIAIGLSKARRAGVPLPPRKGTRRTKAKHRVSPRRSRAVRQALKRQPRRAASHRALSRQAHQAAHQHRVHEHADGVDAQEGDPVACGQAERVHGEKGCGSRRAGHRFLKGRG